MNQTGKTTGYHLKMIALITMCIDHIAAVLLWRVYVASFSIRGAMQVSDFIGDKIIVWVYSNQELVYTIYEYMRLIGRIAFPIYCFLLVEGFLHTRDVKKYALRLGLFALISEVPFDFALNGAIFELGYNNVFFTLLVGLLMCWGLSYVEKFHAFWKEKNWDAFLGKLFTIGAAVLLLFVAGYVTEFVISSDYGIAGIVTIFVMYVLRKYRELAFALAVLALTICTNSTELVALAGLVPLFNYDGSRGRSIKYFFYAFYPAHLLILALICTMIGV